MSTPGFSAFADLRGDLKGVDIANSNPVNLGGSWTDINLDSERKKDSIFEHLSNSAEIKVLEAGLYLVNYSVGIETISGNSRSQTEARLLVNGSEVLNSRSEIYNRLLSQGGGHAHRSFLLDLSQDDILKIQVQRQSGGGTQATIAGASALTILRAESSPGEKGERGATGAGSNVDVEDSGVLLPSSPFDVLNFRNGLSVSEVSGKATIDVSFEAKKTQHLQYVKLENMDFDQYLVSFRDDDDDPRSGSPSNGFQFKQSSPILAIYAGKIIKANFAIKGVAQSTGSAAANVEALFELWSVGFNGEGTKISDITIDIDSSIYTIGNFWNASVNTDFKASKVLDISVAENDLLGLKFIRRTGNNVATVLRETIVSLSLEES